MTYTSRVITYEYRRIKYLSKLGEDVSLCRTPFMMLIDCFLRVLGFKDELKKILKSAHARKVRDYVTVAITSAGKGQSCHGRQ